MMAFKICVFSLNQWALDFTGNRARILKSIDLAYEAGAAYRVGPELEICGYSLEDAFYEQDTLFHSWKCLLDIIAYTSQLDMLIDIGMPIQYSSLYNCRVIIHKGRIICIRAKTSLAKEGIYREFRHFTPWNVKAGLRTFKLPSFVATKLDQQFVPFGANFILELEGIHECDTFRIGWEICQELWDVKNVSSSLYQNFGCHLVVNSSASYWELRKLNTVLDMVRGISLRGGACYAFSNCVGCDGQRYVFYGRSCIFDRGELVAMTSTTTGIFEEVQMVSYSVVPRAIDEYRAQMGIRPDLSNNPGTILDLTDPKAFDATKILETINRITMKFNRRDSKKNEVAATKSALRFEQEIHLYVSLWLWDYLRRSKMVGFIIPLSGGLDSSTVATLVFSMCNHIYQNLDEKQVQEYFEVVHKINSKELVTLFHSPEIICRHILKCCYLSTKYSSQDTLNRAKRLSTAIGALFVSLSLQDIYSRFRDNLTSNTSECVTLLDQNLQARLRMTATYYLSEGNRIVLASGNVDEGIMGYLTKYDCSSADINPIGGLCKNDLKSYLIYCAESIYSNKKDMVELLKEIIDAPPSAELTGAEQRDEDEMGLTYDEISVLGRVRRGVFGCSGPRGAFETIWLNRKCQPYSAKIRCLSNQSAIVKESEVASNLAELVKRFYQRYARNRHKLTVLTPALHAETYSPDDNRFDHRHFLYAPWTEQFKSIDELVEDIKRTECD